MGQLQIVDVSDTGLSGTWASSWAKLNLRDVDVANTKLGGDLPASGFVASRKNVMTGTHFSCPAPQGYEQESVGCPSSSEEDSSSDDSSKGGYIAIGVVIGVAVTMAIAGGAYFVANRSRGSAGQEVLLGDREYALYQEPQESYEVPVASAGASL